MTATSVRPVDAVLTPAERTERGRASREVAPRSALGEFTAAPSRPDPLAVLAEQDRTRVPELLPIRYGRMVASPFSSSAGRRR